MANIFLYDESNQPSGCVELTNLIATYEDYDESIYAKYIHLAWPECTLQLLTFHHPTHIVLENVTTTARTVFEVTSFDSLGGVAAAEGTLVQFHMRVDFIRDYWLNYANANGNYILHRSTDSRYWSKWCTDPLYEFSKDSVVTTGSGYTSMASEDGYMVCFLMNIAGVDQYLLGATGATVPIVCPIGAWNTMRDGMMRYPDIGNAISAAWIVPSWAMYQYAVYGGSYTYATFFRLIRIFTADGIKSLDDFVTFGSFEGGGFILQSILGSGAPHSEQTGLSIDVNNWIDIAATTVYLKAPYLGTFVLNPEIARGDIRIDYVVNLYEGTLTGTVTADGKRLEEYTLSGRLPQVMVPSNAAPQAIRTITNNTVTGAVPAVAGGAMMGATKGGMVGAVVGGAVGLAALVANTAGQIDSAKYGAVTYSPIGGYDGYTDSRYRMTFVQSRSLMSLGDFAATRGYLSNVRLGSLGALSRGNSHWLDMSGSYVYGPSEYAEQVRQAYHNTRIYIPE